MATLSFTRNELMALVDALSEVLDPVGWDEAERMPEYELLTKVTAALREEES